MLLTGLRERASEQQGQGTGFGDMLLGNIEAPASVLTGAMAWPISKAAGGMSLLTSMLLGDTPQQTEEIVQGVEGSVADFLTYKPRTKTGQFGFEKVSEGIEAALDPILKAANVKGDWYKPIGISNITEIDPRLGWAAGLAVELAAFKGVHSVGKGTKARIQKYKKLKEQKKWKEMAREAENEAAKLYDDWREIEGIRAAEKSAFDQRNRPVKRTMAEDYKRVREEKAERIKANNKTVSRTGPRMHPNVRAQIEADLAARARANRTVSRQGPRMSENVELEMAFKELTDSLQVLRQNKEVSRPVPEELGQQTPRVDAPAGKTTGKLKGLKEKSDKAREEIEAGKTEAVKEPVVEEVPPKVREEVKSEMGEGRPVESIEVAQQRASTVAKEAGKWLKDPEGSGVNIENVKARLREITSNYDPKDPVHAQELINPIDDLMIAIAYKQQGPKAELPKALEQIQKEHTTVKKMPGPPRKPDLVDPTVDPSLLNTPKEAKPSLTVEEAKAILEQGVIDHKLEAQKSRLKEIGESKEKPKTILRKKPGPKKAAEIIEEQRARDEIFDEFYEDRNKLFREEDSIEELSFDDTVSTWRNLIDNERGTITLDLRDVKVGINKLISKYGKRPKAASLLNRLTKEGMKKDDLKVLGITDYLLGRPSQERIRWGTMLKEIGKDKFGLRKETVIGQNVYGPDRHPELNLPGEKGNYTENLYRRPLKATEGRFNEGHWYGRGRNVLAHRRSHDRDLTTGEDVRFVDEVQSVWIERGKQQGFGKSRPEDIAAAEHYTLAAEAATAHLASKIESRTRRGEIIRDLYKNNREHFDYLMDAIDEGGLSVRTSNVLRGFRRRMERGEPDWYTDQILGNIRKKGMYEIGSRFNFPSEIGTMVSGKFKDFMEAYSEKISAAQRAHIEINRARVQVPETPFKDSWYKILMRDAMIEAVRNNKDGLAWATSKIHKDRYSYVNKEFKMLDRLYDKQIPKFIKTEFGVKPELKKTIIDTGHYKTENVWYVPINEKMKKMYREDVGESSLYLKAQHGESPMKYFVKAAEEIDLYGAKEMGKDFLTLFGDERGSFSTGKLSPERAAALQRIAAKLKREGKSLREYLGKMGLEKETIDQLVESAKVVQEEAIEAKKTFKPYSGDPKGIVKQRPTKSFHDGERLMNPAVTKEWADAFINMKKLPKTAFAQLRKKFENPLRTFEKLGPEVKRLVYDPYRKAERVIADKVKAVRTEVAKIEKQFSTKEKRRMGAYWIAMQEGPLKSSREPRGPEFLKSMGIKEIPQLTPKELEGVKNLSRRFEALLEEVNAMRVSIGKKPIEKLDNYLSFMRTYNLMEQLGLESNPIHTPISRIRQNYAQLSQKPVSFMHRRKPTRAYSIELDPFIIFDKYMESARRHIELSPLIAKIKEANRGFKDANGNYYAPRYENFEAFDFIREWTNYIGDMPQQGSLGALNRPLRLLSNNLVMAMLSWNFRSAAIQASALRNTYAEIGAKHTLRGLYSNLRPKNRNHAIHKSNHLNARLMDVDMATIARRARSGGDFRKLIAKVGMEPLKWLDMETARSTWLGAYEYARDVHKIKNERALIEYADDVVIKTQASGLKGDLAPVQRTSVGRLLTLMQTFTINDWGFLVNDVIKAKGLSTPAKAAKIYRYLIGTMLVNAFYEDVMGIKSPFPTPARAVKEGLENDDNFLNTFGGAAMELIEPIPILGSTRYGGTPMGAAFDLITKIPEDVKKAAAGSPYHQTRLVEDVGKMAGIPGTSQIGKSVRTAKRKGKVKGILPQTLPEDAGELYRVMMGQYDKPKNKSKRRNRRPRF